MRRLNAIVKKLASGARNIAIGAFLGSVLYSCPGDSASKKTEREEATTILKQNELPGLNEVIYKSDKGFKVDNGRIYFVSNREDRQWDIYSMNLNTEEVTRLTNTPEQEVNPSTSPDGKWLAFGADDNSNLACHIYVMPAEGGEALPLTDGPYRDTQPAWHPEMKELAFTRNFGGFDLEVCVVHIKPTVNPVDIQVMNNGRVQNQTMNDKTISDHSASFSPDGKNLAYVREEHFEQKNSNEPFLKSSIWIRDSNGNKRKITTDGYADFYYKTTWSPSGDKIICKAYIRTKGHVVLIDPKTKEVVDLTKIAFKDSTGVSMTNPSFSPKGDRIVCEVSSGYRSDNPLFDDYRSELCVFDLEGRKKFLTDNQYVDKEPSWRTE